MFQGFQHRLEILAVKLRSVVVPVQIAVKIMEIQRIIEGFCVPKGFLHLRQLAVREKQPGSRIGQERFEPGFLQPGEGRFQPVRMMQNRDVGFVLPLLKQRPAAAGELGNDGERAFAVAVGAADIVHVPARQRSAGARLQHAPHHIIVAPVYLIKQFSSHQISSPFSSPSRQYISYIFSQSYVILATAKWLLPWMSKMRPVKVLTQESISLVSKNAPL